MFANHYDRFGNPYFEADGSVWDREVMPSDPGRLSPRRIRRRFRSLPGTGSPTISRSPLTKREPCCGCSLAMSVGPLRYYRMPSQRLRAFVTQSSRIAAELHEARERILDKAEAVSDQVLPSDDPKRRDSTARYILTKSQKPGRARFHALTDHLGLETGGGAVVFGWVE